MENKQIRRKNAFYSKKTNKIDINKLIQSPMYNKAFTLQEKINNDLKFDTNEFEDEHNTVNNDENFINKKTLFNTNTLQKNINQISSFEEIKISLNQIKTKSNKIDNSKFKIKQQNDDELLYENEPFLSLSKSFVGELDNYKMFGNFCLEYNKNVINYKRKNSFSYFKEKKEKKNNFPKLY